MSVCPGGMMGERRRCWGTQEDQQDLRADREKMCKTPAVCVVCRGGLQPALILRSGFHLWFLPSLSFHHLRFWCTCTLPHLPFCCTCDPMTASPKHPALFSLCLMSLSCVLSEFLFLRCFVVYKLNLIIQRLKSMPLDSRTGGGFDVQASWWPRESQ